MTFQELETAIGQHLEAMTDCPPIAWPNQNFTPSGLYLEFRLAPNEVLDPVISGGFEYEVGLVLITIVAPRGEFSTEANTLAEQIAQRFPKALRLPAGDGNVVINAPTSRATPFPDGTYWRQPLRVSYVTE